MRKAMFALTVLAAACGGEEFLPANPPGQIENQPETATPGMADDFEPNWA